VNSPKTTSDPFAGSNPFAVSFAGSRKRLPTPLLVPLLFLLLVPENDFRPLCWFWNGLGFDLDILAEESGMLSECRQLAASHIDMMFHVFCELGHGVGLDAAVRGMGLAGKLEGMKGADAPVLWAEGKREEVLQYVGQDVRATLELATACEASGMFRWVARSGKVRSMALAEGWLMVSEAQRLPLPDTSWMDSPWERERFTGWMG
jgi:hypothetical protein